MAIEYECCPYLLFTARLCGARLPLIPVATDLTCGRGQSKMSRNESRSHILSSSQVAASLQISKKTLDRMIKDGRIPEPNRHPNNNWRFWTSRDLEEIKQILAEDK